MPRWTEADLARLTGARIGTSGKPSKYRNTPTVVDGQRFDSRLEADYYRDLMLLQKAGAISYFLRQVPFALPGGIRYRLDFLIVKRLEDNFAALSYVDCKGFLTATSRIKIKQVESIYGISITLVRKAG